MIEIEKGGKMAGIETEGEGKVTSLLELRKQRRAENLREKRRQRLAKEYHLPADTPWEKALEEHQRRHPSSQGKETPVVSQSAVSIRNMSRKIVFKEGG